MVVMSNTIKLHFPLAKIKQSHHKLGEALSVPGF
jgi:hypothetical protein